MRVAVWYNLGGGGAKRALHQHVSGLVGRGHHVEVWCPSTARTDFLPLADICPEHVDPVDHAKLRVGGTRRELLVQALRPATGLIELDRHLARCAVQIRDGRFDVVFANTCQYNAVPDLANRVERPTLLYLQEPRRASYEAHPVLPWVGSPDTGGQRSSLRRAARELSMLRYVRTLARREVAAAASYDRLLVNSVFSRESVGRAYGVDATVCYLGVDTDLFTPGSGGSRDHFITVGQLVRHKRQDLIIEAVATLRGHRPRLVCIGDRTDGAYVGELRELAERRHVALDIRESLSDHELLELMRSARALVHAARLEPFGYTPIEAGACGIPAIVVAEGGLRETVVDGLNGWVVEPTREAIGAAMAQCLDDEQEARNRGARGRASAVERWSLTSATARLEGHLLDVAQLQDVPDGA